MKNRYKVILKKDKNIALTASSLSDNYPSSFGQLSVNLITPVLVMYVYWILTEARHRNINRLYFLARDGYVLYHIAIGLCEKMKLDIECSYFYCSRYSLRMATYCFFDESAYEKLFIHAYKLSPRNMLKRAGFSKDERFNVYKEMSCVPFNENAVMSRSEFNDFCDRVKKTSYFKNLLKSKSDIAYKNTIAYIRQEGMQNYDRIGIVDLGWTGSMQYTLRRLLDSNGIETRVIGFYIGMLEKPRFQENSEYITWLFDEKNTYTKSWFAHNLLECMCSAPHGMTVGYCSENGRIKPVFEKSENPHEFISTQKKISDEFVELCGETNINKHKRIAKRLLKKMMFHPTEREAEIFKAYRFCDDIGEQYHTNLVQNAEKKEFREQLIFHKLRNRDSSDGFYWYYGSLKASNLLMKTFYKYMYFYTRYVTSKFRQGVS